LANKKVEFILASPVAIQIPREIFFSFPHKSWQTKKQITMIDGKYHLEKTTSNSSEVKR